MQMSNFIKNKIKPVIVSVEKLPSTSVGGSINYAALATIRGDRARPEGYCQALDLDGMAPPAITSREGETRPFFL